MSQARRTIAMFLALGVFTSLAGAQVTPPTSTPEPKLDDRDINLGYPDADPDRVTALIAQLGDPEFKQREAASQALTELCPGAFRRMARAYREDDDYEVRIRIQEIVQERYLWHTLLRHNGFLGVAYDSSSKIPGNDDEVRAVIITRVEPNSAAGEAGLRAGDRILSIDGKPFADDKDDDEFRNRIQSKGAGGKALFEIARGSESFMVEVTLRARPIDQYSDARGSTLLDQLNARLQQYSLWWNRFFGKEESQTQRTPSTAVLELPE